ncbi:hypothetical protein DPMN_102935 [Dreissena polymorpha]|uniref:Uncharacterized protein n=1 Tax=Dreissena polymorpha TaxID=45954 RepID=A0A9D4H7J2_DREPO|nr:hypothetical protein DPMN_102935 [Dreissena polymorpha]
MEMAGTCPFTTLNKSVILWARRRSWSGGSSNLCSISVIQPGCLERWSLVINLAADRWTPSWRSMSVWWNGSHKTLHFLV